MNMEFVGVVFVYMFVINFIMKKVGGAELRELEKDIRKYLEKAKKGDETAFKKLNAANSKRMRLAMKANLYLFPIILPAIWFIKSRYAELQWTIFGHSFGWLGSFLILGIPLSMVSDRIVKKLLKYS